MNAYKPTAHAGFERLWFGLNRTIVVVLAVGIAMAGVAGIAVLSGSTVSAAPLPLYGTVTTDLSIMLDHPHETFWRNELEVGLAETVGAFDILATIRLQHDSSEDNARFDMSEASLVWYGNDWRVNAGRQVVNWGMALKLNPLNVVNPVDVTDHAMELLPVQSVAVTYYPNSDWEVTGVWIPEFRSGLDKGPTNMLGPGMSMPHPETTLENTQLAGRALYRGRGYDLAVIGFYGWDDLPYMRMGPTWPHLSFDRVATVGLGYASSLGDAGLWAEGRQTTYPEDGDRERAVELVLGGDYSFENGITLLGQMRWFDDGVNPEQTQLMTTVQGEWASIHEWRVGLIVDPNAKTWSLRPEVEFSLADAVTATAYAAVASDSGSSSPAFVQPDHIGLRLAAAF